MSQVALLNRESKEGYIKGDAFTWCPCCGEPYILSEEEVRTVFENEDASVYAECPECLNSFYLEKEDDSFEENGVVRHYMSKEKINELYRMLDNFIADCSREEYEKHQKAFTEIKTLLHGRM